MDGLSFHEAFKGLNPPHYGRYFKTKLYEVLRRTTIAINHPTGLPEMEDIVPRGGAHPRKALIHFYPGHKYKSDAKDDLEEANSLAGELKDRLQAAGVEGVDWFVLEVLLCNYRQAVNGGQYPGRAHDSELGHCTVVGKRFPGAGKVLRNRSELFKPEYLGEVGKKWPGRRLELGKVMMLHGYVWSDELYDYVGTTDLKHPAKRENGRV